MGAFVFVSSQCSLMTQHLPGSVCRALLVVESRVLFSEGTASCVRQCAEAVHHRTFQQQSQGGFKCNRDQHMSFADPAEDCSRFLKVKHPLYLRFFFRY